MTEHSPITPPPELIIKAADDAGLCFPTCWGLVNAEEDDADDAAFAATSPEAAEIVARHKQLKKDRIQQLRNFWSTAASYGADTELEACCGLMDDWGLEASDLRAARRPKPPSLKEQSLALINRIQSTQEAWLVEELDVVRKALEALPDA